MVWPSADGLLYGGDYNPEQWPRTVWEQDAALMREAGVTMVSLGIFSWSLLEPAPGRYELRWLDDVVGLMHEHGIAVDLATGTASPPPWFSHAHPESLPVRADGVRLWPGARQAYCPSSPAYREAATALATTLATHFAGHPALAMWHVNNEYGCHAAHCYCDVSAAAFREWLQRRYDDIDGLNVAWGTAFWSQHYYAWDEVLPPRTAPTFANPTQQLDYWRFSSDELLACFTAERDVLHRVTPGIPVTTNLMLPGFKATDARAWGQQMDVVSNDHYLLGADHDPAAHLALGADMTRGAAGGAPWLLMEHSPSAVNWQPRNLAKAPGQMRRNSLTHVARGADGVMFFQWRASRAGAEKFHSGMLPHAGTDTKVWREVVGLGADLAAISEVVGSTVESDVAILHDWQSWWGIELDSHPSSDVSYLAQLRPWYEALRRRHVTADLVSPRDDLSRYRVILVPALYLVDDAGAAAVADFAESGGTVVVGFFSGIVDENDHIRLGGYPGAFADLLGVRTEEFFPLAEGETADLDDGAQGTVWSESTTAAEGTEVLARWSTGPVVGSPVVTRRAAGAGSAWYVGTRLDTEALDRLLARVCDGAGVVPTAEAGDDLEVVRRRHADGRSYLFAVNHGPADSLVGAGGTDLLTGRTTTAPTPVPAGGVVVLRESGG